MAHGGLGLCMGGAIGGGACGCSVVWVAKACNVRWWAQCAAEQALIRVSP